MYARLAKEASPDLSPDNVRGSEKGQDARQLVRGSAAELSTEKSRIAQDRAPSPQGESADAEASGTRTRYPARSKRAACPLCGKFFFDLVAHAATCQLEESPTRTTPISSAAAQDASNKKRRPKSAAGSAVEDKFAGGAQPQVAPKKRQRPALEGPSSYFQENHLPSVLPSPPVEDEHNKEIARRERALLAAAASAAAQNHSGKHMKTELVELETGVTMVVSDVPFRDGQGQGLAFTLRNELRRMVDELTALRDSDSYIREENATLRVLVQDIQRKAAEELAGKVEVMNRERDAWDEAQAQLQSQLAELRKDRKRLETELAQSNSQLATVTSDLTEVEAGRQALHGDLEKVRGIVEDLKRTNATEEKEKKSLQEVLSAESGKVKQLRQELESLKNEFVLKQDELEELRRDLEHAQAMKPSILDDDGLNGFDNSADVLQQEVEEYLGLLKDWLLTHNMSIRTPALAVFQGTKPRANTLWHSISAHLGFADVIARHGHSKGILLSADQQTITLMPQETPEPRQQQSMMEDLQGSLDLNTFMLGDDDLLPGVSLEPASRLISAEESLVERVVAWLEEKGGIAPWSDFQETFASYQGKFDELCALSASQFFALDDGRLVLSSSAESVLVSLFCDYLKRGHNGVAPASRFHHFLETTQGVLRIRDRLPDTKLAALAGKYPDRLHFWRESDGSALCCVKEELPRLEREKAERKRLADLAQMEVDRKRAEQEMMDAEARARSEWLAHSRPPPTIADPSMAPQPPQSFAGGNAGQSLPQAPPNMAQSPQTQPPPPMFGSAHAQPPAAQRKTSRWGSDSSISGSSMQPPPFDQGASLRQHPGMSIQQQQQQQFGPPAGVMPQQFGGVQPQQFGPAGSIPPQQPSQQFGGAPGLMPHPQHSHFGGPPGTGPPPPYGQPQLYAYVQQQPPPQGMQGFSPQPIQSLLPPPQQAGAYHNGGPPPSIMQYKRHG